MNVFIAYKCNDEVADDSERTTIIGVYQTRVQAEQAASGFSEYPYTSWIQAHYVETVTPFTDPNQPHQVHYSIGRALQTLREFKVFPEKEEWRIDDTIERLQKVSDWFVNLDKGEIVL